MFGFVGGGIYNSVICFLYAAADNYKKVPMAKKGRKIHKGPAFIRISSLIEGKESCIFCGKPNTGHLITDLEKDVTDFLKAVAISICRKCEKHKKDSLAAVLGSTLE
jgi:hypothetical protein